jgi:TonB family protein
MRSNALYKWLFIGMVVAPVVLCAQSTFKPVPRVLVDKMPQYPAGNKVLAKMFADSIELPSSKWEEVADSELRTELVLSIVVNEQGKVEDVNVLKSMNAKNDARCVSLARKLIFNPAMKDGKPIKVRFILPLSFDF